ncbi:unnamed protein product [Rotaria socialis]|uniref:Uncharacterized protein n=1 Tax=Rotaria socialis TaxID=392032 RepID=A0A820CWK4_9BILA|nr:unnamed protein product [Rotaria socialis]
MDEPNSFSVVSIRRLINVDSFGKGSIREQNKTYRITVERTGKLLIVQLFRQILAFYGIGTLIEMVQFAQEAEELSTYKMNSDVVSDTEEWFKRKKSLTRKNNDKPNLFDKQLTEQHTFDLDVYRTYITSNTCLFDEPKKAAGKTIDGHIFNSTLNRIPTSKSRKHTSSRVSRQIPEKRLRVNDASSPTVNEGKLGVDQSSSSSINAMNYKLGQLRKQIADLTRSYDQHQKTLNLVLNNQNKIAKAMRNHKIPIVLIDETGHGPSASTIDSSTITCKSTTGEQIELLQIPTDRMNSNKFVLKAVDRIFKDGKELIDLDPRSIDTDDRIKTIRDAVQVKFGLTNDELATVWMPMLECIKSKRRNSKAKLRNTTTSNENSLRII